MSTSAINPKVTLGIIQSPEISSVEERRVLIVGQQGSTATVASGGLTQNINSLTSVEVNTLFEAGSLISIMIARAQKVLSGIIPQPIIDVIGLDDDGSAVQAEAIITFTGTAIEDGELTFFIGSKADYAFDVAVSDTDTATDVAGALVAAITVDTDAPFTAANVAGVVTITARNGGTIPNTWGIGFNGNKTVAGIAIALTTEFIGGLTDPALTAVFDNVENIRYTTVIWPETYDLPILSAFLDPRFNATNQVLDGVGINVKADTLTNLKTAVSALNSQSLVVIGNTYDTTGAFLNKKGPGIFEISDLVATEIGIIRALRLTEGAPISSFVNVAGAPGDAFGGINIAAKPYFNTNLPNIAVGDIGEYFSSADQVDLESNGIATFGNNPPNSSVVMGVMVTTYLTDTGGNDDTSFKFLNTVDQMSIIREFYTNNFRSKYAQSRLTDGAISPGVAKENQESIRGFCVLLYQDLAAEDITEDGGLALQDYKDSLTVVVDRQQGLVTINQAPPLVGQVRQIQGTIQVNFN